MIASQPVRYPRNRRDDAGASIETQWYCPPDVGAIETNSLSVVKTESVPTQTTRNPYRIPEGPPLPSVSNSQKPRDTRCIVLLQPRKKRAIRSLATCRRRENDHRQGTYVNDPSQVMSTVQLNPRIVMKPKLRFNTAFLPRRANAISSRDVESERLCLSTVCRPCSSRLATILKEALRLRLSLSLDRSQQGRSNKRGTKKHKKCRVSTRKGYGVE